MALGVFLIWTWSGILWSPVGDTLGKRLTDEELDIIRHAIDAEGVEGYHELRTRCSGQVCRIDSHITLPGEMTVDDAHAVTDRIEALIEAAWPGSVVTVHVEPMGTGPSARLGL